AAAQLPAEAPHVSAVPSRTSAIFPPEAARFVVPLVSGAGSGAPTEAAEASCTRKYLPGWIVPVSGVACQLVDAADAYCTDQPVTVTGAPPRLNSSTKSFVYGAPELPPPANTWPMTTFDVAPCANGTAASATARQSASETRIFVDMSGSRVRWTEAIRGTG